MVNEFFEKMKYVFKPKIDEMTTIESESADETILTGFETAGITIYYK